MNKQRWALVLEADQIVREWRVEGMIAHGRAYNLLNTLSDEELGEVIGDLNCHEIWPIVDRIILERQGDKQ